MVTKTRLTLEEFDRLPEDGLRHELNQGELLTMTLPTPSHNRVVRRIFLILHQFLEQHSLGEVFFPDTPFLLSDAEGRPTLRGPDLAYLPQERAAGINEKERIKGAPELAIEVVSPTDTTHDLLEKTAQYLGAGGHTVWIVYPEEREVRVFEASGAIRILRAGQNIDAPDLLPGFSAPVSAFFA